MQFKFYIFVGYSLPVKTLVAILSFLILLSFDCIAQDLEWVSIDAGVNTIFNKEIAIDYKDNVIAIGSFSGTVDFDDSQDSIIRNGRGEANAYVKKTNKSGKALWVLSFDKRVYRVYFNDLVIDRFNNILVTGYFYDDIEFSTLDGLVKKSSKVDGSPFVFKVNSRGDIIWVETYARGGQCSFTSIDLYENEEILVGGFFQGIVEFKNSTTVNYDSSFSKYSGLVLKLGQRGEFVWSKTFVGTSSTRCMDAKFDNEGNIITTGFFGGVTDFNPSRLSSFELGSRYSHDYFTVKLGPSGNFLWANILGNDSTNQSGYPSLAISKSGFVYLYGNYNGTIDFDPSTNQQILTSVTGSIFLQKLSRSGSLVWVKNLSSSKDVVGVAIKLDEDENAIIAGVFEESIDADPGYNSVILEAKGESDGFIEKLDRNGNLVWVQQFESSKRTSIVTLAFGKEAIYAAGGFNGETDFDPSIGFSLRTSSGNYDAFTLKLSVCITNASLTENICFGDSVIFKQKGIKEDGAFRDTLTNMKGCDSLVILQVNIFPHQEYYDTASACDSFLWLDNRTYYSNATLSYVAKTTNGCDSTIYLNLTIENCSFNVFIPNAFSPNNDGLNDRFKPVSERIESYEMSIYTRWGELIYKSSHPNGWDGAAAQSGIYLYDIRIIGNDGKETIKRRESGVVHLLK
jgi:gliding motility-associated-like protein